MDEAVNALVRTLLYEGYLLWPYRRSALKNRYRWTLGCVFPAACARAAEGDGPSEVEMQCLVEGAEGVPIDGRLRFLQVVHRQVLSAGACGSVETDTLEVGGRRWLTWDETTEREVPFPLEVCPDGIERSRPFLLPAGNETEWLADGGGTAGALVRTWRTLRGRIETKAEPAGAGLVRLAVRVVNETDRPGGGRDEAVRSAFASTHVLLESHRGGFVSLADPPPAAVAAARACRNVGLWPVLVGDPATRHVLLASPVTMNDWPRVAPESPGDHYDGTEIDELLVLNVLALTEEEKCEARASDPRAAEILDRSERLGSTARARLHGVLRDVREVGS